MDPENIVPLYGKIAVQAGVKHFRVAGHDVVVVQLVGKTAKSADPR